MVLNFPHFSAEVDGTIVVLFDWPKSSMTYRNCVQSVEAEIVHDFGKGLSFLLSARRVNVRRVRSNTRCAK